MRLDKLDLNLLVVLDALLEELNVTRAAERLHLSQPATSNALQRLRAHFSDPLIVSTGRRLVKTHFACEIEPVVRNLVSQGRALASRRAAFDPRDARRTFSVCASDYTTRVLLIDLMRDMASSAPGVVIDIHPTDASMLGRFESGEVEILLAPAPFVSKDHPHVVLFEEPFCCVAWQGNESIPQHLTLSAYVAAEHVAIHGYDGLRSSEDEMLRAQGLSRRIVGTSPNYTLLPFFVAGTTRIATVQRSLAERLASTAQLRVLALAFELPKLVMHMQWHRHQDEDLGLQWLRRSLAHAAAGLGGGGMAPLP